MRSIHSKLHEKLSTRLSVNVLYPDNRQTDEVPNTSLNMLTLNKLQHDLIPLGQEQ